MFENYKNILSKATTTRVKKILIKKANFFNNLYLWYNRKSKGSCSYQESIMHNLFGALEIMDEFQLNNERFFFTFVSFL